MQQETRRMKIGLFSPKPFSLKLGATKNRVELAEALTELGWECEIIDSSMLGVDHSKSVDKQVYMATLKGYLIKNSHLYDIVLYEYDTLPFDRSTFPERPLLIARPALLHHHLEKISFKYDNKTKIKHFIKILVNKVDAKAQKDHLKTADMTLANCDVIQVQNKIDYTFLQKRFPGKKIILIPNGIAKDRFIKFQSIDRDYRDFSTHPKIAFVGTFDFRKGAVDFIKIIRAVSSQFPTVTFCFLGSLGLFTSSQSIYNFFPRSLRKFIEVVPSFDPLELPEYLKKCHLGVFPSYLESFGFGALEMMCSGLPVVGYNCPGPSDFLISDLICEIGDQKGVSKKLIQLLSDAELTKKYSIRAKNIVKYYQWDSISQAVDKKYKELLNEKKSH